MSTKGVYSALSGALAQSQRLDTIANNLANVNTAGFKKDQQVFREYLTANEKMPEVIQAPRVVASIESFYDTQGGEKSYVDSAGTYTDFTQGSLKSTGAPLDIAIDGGGFFEINTPAGVRLTRVGSFKLDSAGQLVTKDGYHVLKAGPEGADPTSRVIRFQGQGTISISNEGEIIEGDQSLGKISLVNVPNKDSLSKVGAGYFDFKKNATREITNVPNPSVKQGFIESSNVNIVQEMTDMISTTRLFESSQKAIQAYDSMSDKLINVVGSIK